MPNITVDTQTNPDELNKETGHDDNYANKQALGEQMLNTALLASNAAQLKTLTDIAESERNNVMWEVEMALLILSILLQTLAGVMLLITHFMRPLKHGDNKWYYRRSMTTASLVLVITVINYIISALGAHRVTSDMPTNNSTN